MITYYIKCFQPQIVYEARKHHSVVLLLGGQYIYRLVFSFTVNQTTNQSLWRTTNCKEHVVNIPYLIYEVFKVFLSKTLTKCQSQILIARLFYVYCLFHIQNIIWAFLFFLYVGWIQHVPSIANLVTMVMEGTGASTDLNSWAHHVPYISVENIVSVS